MLKQITNILRNEDATYREMGFRAVFDEVSHEIQAQVERGELNKIKYHYMGMG